MNPIFIVGCERSGTTLMRLMLNRHPRIAIPGETWYFPDLDRRRRHWKSAGDWRELVAEFIQGQRTFPELGVSEAALRAVLQRLDLGDWGSVLASANIAFAELESKPRWGDKTPGYVHHLAFIRRVFPSAFIIHMIRDCRDVVVSLTQQPFGPNTVVDAARHWRRSVSRGMEFGPSLFKDRYLEVRYEQLVAQPHSVMEKICDALGETFYPDMISQRDRDRAYLLAEHHWHDQATKPVTTARIGRWKEQLTSRDVQFIELISGDLMDRLGYKSEANISIPVLAAWSWLELNRAWKEAVLNTKVGAYRLLQRFGWQSQ